MTRLRLTLAIGDYDHTRDVAQGVVQPEGIEIVHLALPIEEIFFRFTKFREWDASEMSFGKVVALASQDDRSLVALRELLLERRELAVADLSDALEVAEPLRALRLHLQLVDPARDLLHALERLLLLRPARGESVASLLGLRELTLDRLAHIV